MIRIIFLIFLFLTVYLMNTKENFNNILEITSDSFEDGGMITQKHACLEKGGSDILPHLYIKHPRNNDVKSYALLLEDLDAPHDRDTNWTHWVIPYISTLIDDNGNVTNEFTIPSINATDEKNISIGVEQREFIQGVNSWDTIGYRGMCPPKNILHNYRLFVYALNTKIEDCENCSRNSLINRIQSNKLYSGSINFKFKSNK